MLEAATSLQPELEGTSKAVDDRWREALPSSERGVLASLEQLEAAVACAIRAGDEEAARADVTSLLASGVEPRQVLSRIGRAFDAVNVSNQLVELPTEEVFLQSRVLESLCDLVDGSCELEPADEAG